MEEPQLHKAELYAAEILFSHKCNLDQPINPQFGAQKTYQKQYDLKWQQNFSSPQMLHIFLACPPQSSRTWNEGPGSICWEPPFERHLEPSLFAQGDPVDKELTSPSSPTFLTYLFFQSRAIQMITIILPNSLISKCFLIIFNHTEGRFFLFRKCIFKCIFQTIIYTWHTATF